MTININELTLLKFAMENTMRVSIQHIELLEKAKAEGFPHHEAERALAQSRAGHRELDCLHEKLSSIIKSQATYSPVREISVIRTS